MQKYILSAVVKNNSGVLARVSSLFGRRGFNIDSLTVSETNSPEISRMSIIVQGDEATLEQIIKQFSKLEETISVEQLWEDESYCKELLFVKLRADTTQIKESIREIAEIYNASVIQSDEGCIIAELTEVPSRIEAFLNVISHFEIIEMCRSGVTAMIK